MAAAAHPSVRWHCFIFHSCFDGNLSTLHGIYAICAIFSTFQWSYLSLNDKWELDGRSRAHKPFFYGILYCFYDGIIFTVRLSCVTCCLFFCLSCTHSSNPFAQHPKVFHFSTEWWALLRRNVEHWMKFDFILHHHCPGHLMDILLLMTSANCRHGGGGSGHGRVQNGLIYDSTVFIYNNC